MGNKNSNSMNKIENWTCNEQINGLNDQIKKLQEEKNELEEKMVNMKAYYKKELSSIKRQRISNELMNELFGSLPFENAYGFLAKMPNGLLARNVQKMIKSIKMEMRENKLLAIKNDSSKLAISEDGLIVKHSGTESNFVLAELPIPKFKFSMGNAIITFYFEVQILEKNGDDEIRIGFCEKDFPLEYEMLGLDSNSIGIEDKEIVWIDEEVNFLENDAEFGYFEKSDVIGLGIIQYPENSLMQCFATCNGQFLGKVKMPPKFANFQLFPAIDFENAIVISINFGMKEWLFKQFDEVFECQNAQLDAE